MRTRLMFLAMALTAAGVAACSAAPAQPLTAAGHPTSASLLSLAVSASAAPFATVSVTDPAGATLLYGSATHVGDLASAPSGQALVAASRREVRLPVCGPSFTGYVGGIVATKPVCVTFEVTSPGSKPATVSVPVGPATCSPQTS